jgi:hypothetical protein
VLAWKELELELVLELELNHRAIASESLISKPSFWRNVPAETSEKVVSL